MRIQYSVKSCTGFIDWSASEDFRELEGKKFELRYTTAKEIAMNTSLSLYSQILLSAVAGACIQHLLDKGISADEIFNTGVIYI